MDPSPLRSQVDPLRVGSAGDQGCTQPVLQVTILLGVVAVLGTVDDAVADRDQSCRPACVFPVMCSDARVTL